MVLSGFGGVIGLAVGIVLVVAQSVGEFILVLFILIPYEPAPPHVNTRPLWCLIHGGKVILNPLFYPLGFSHEK